MKKIIQILTLFILTIIITACTTETNSSLNSTSSNTKCHPNYSGCLKANASDYDCAGGSGNGPYYTGKVKIIGSDVFGLDRDNDGWGCE